MKLALAGLFLMFAVMFGGLASRTHSIWFILWAGGSAIVSMVCSASVLKGYNGEKR